jgi:NADPH:quinone reductase-like Zn-dependent oxidoreductase
MKAIVHDGYGPPEDLQLREIDKPRIDGNGVLIRVRAASVNPYDWRVMRGEPRALRKLVRTPSNGRIPGADVAGQVEAVGASVKHFRPGDKVFGTCRGAFAEYAGGGEKTFAPKPSALTDEQAASIPIAGCTALQALRDHGRLQPGERVLINGAAGGVGTFAVQIARALGAHVTGVCSTRNVDLVRSLGADHVIDYTAEDFVASGQQYDLIVQINGNRTVKDMQRALAPKGRLVAAGGGVGRDDDGGDGLGTVFTLMIKGQLLSRFIRPRTSAFMARIRRDDLQFIARLVERGTLSPVIDRRYSLAEVPEAIRHLETGHARGKVIVTVS